MGFFNFFSLEKKKIILWKKILKIVINTFSLRKLFLKDTSSTFFMLTIYVE